MAPMVAEGTQQFEFPVSVAVVSVFGLVFSFSIFAWICCQRKKTPKTPPYKFVHMLKGVDIYPEGLSANKKKFAASAAETKSDSNDPKIDVNGNCRQASSPPGGRTSLHLDLDKRDLNGNFTKPNHTQNLNQNQNQKVRSSPDLEVPSPHPTLALASPCGSSFSSQAPTPALDRPQDEASEAGLGTLSFSLDYQEDKKALVVHIKQAHGLTPTDEQSLTSDPYIKLTLLPEKKHRVKTRVLRKTLDPAFDETFSFYGVPLAGVPGLSLHFNVLSFDRFSRDEVIGETLVPLAGIDLSEGRVLMTREIIKRNVRKAVGRGELLLSLCYQSTSSTLTLVVLKARHLPKTDNHGPTDPYVKVNLYQGKKRVCKKKTHVKKCSPNPVFNELFVFDVPWEAGLRDASVELLLLDSERGGAGGPPAATPVLGRLLLGSAAPGTPGEHWREISDHPRRQIAKWHALSD
ncbi:synaptotagmin-4 isoform X2 [Hypomesus transpacificus]|uniref:synaptotagmin-4 isoform X2 n=1 Tax=Hypomesus transpacificus TaxID=137520 RepID=UPI001F083E9A|nr:synaptotagmin-4 isoform X2 [Hypomesus transpacificus]